MPGGPVGRSLRGICRRERPLREAHMQLAGPEIDVIPAQGDKLAGAQLVE